MHYFINHQSRNFAIMHVIVIVVMQHVLKTVHIFLCFAFAQLKRPPVASEQ